MLDNVIPKISHLDPDFVLGMILLNELNILDNFTGLFYVKVSSISQIQKICPDPIELGPDPGLRTNKGRLTPKL